MTKERLRNLRESLRELKQLREQIKNAEARIYSPKSPVLSDMPKAPSLTSNPTSDAALLHEQLVTLYETKIKCITTEMLEVEKAMVETLNPVECIIIRYRYFDLMTWEEICVKAHYGWTQTHRIHASALRKLETS